MTEKPIAAPQGITAEQHRQLTEWNFVPYYDENMGKVVYAIPEVIDDCLARGLDPAGPDHPVASPHVPAWD